MSGTTASPTAPAPIAALESALESVADEVTADILKAEAAYRRFPNAVLTHDTIREHAIDNLRQITAALAGRPDSVEPAQASGHYNAELGVPLASVLHAYRLAGLRMWQELVTLAGDNTEPGDMLALSTSLWHTIDRYSTASAEAYYSVLDERGRRDEQTRRVTLMGLLNGDGAASQGTVRHILDLPGKASFVVVVAELSGQGDPPPVVGSRSHGRAVTATWVQSAEEHIGLLAAATPEAIHAVVDELHLTARARVGVSRPFAALGEAPEAQRQAKTALKCLPPGAAGTTQYGNAPLDALLASNDKRTLEYATTVFAGLDRLDQRDAAALVDTLEAWFDNGGSSAAAAAALHCHRNTVLNRLSRIADLTSRSVSDPKESAELYAALRARRLSPRPQHP
ncbi:helix-turn-helix domain-containing protein [Gryllotalpicola sp.]|uniref:PucR family transcriptional regulator n=1 Tax=Gryllotalpicola sp. TaxID=1932787 RepID=UPI0026285DE6|nr:helix-turn-helix domain-containing protein [Gryllotalpicola sp.]